MVPQQKEAVVALCSSLVFTSLLPLVRPLAGSFRIEAIFVTLVAFIATLWIGRVLVGLKAKALDERDLAIRYQAGLVATHGFGIVVMVGAAILCLLHREILVVPTEHVALLAYYGWMTLYLVWSVTVLILYRKGV